MSKMIYTPVHNLEAEQAVLGAVLANFEAMNHVGTDLKPEHFYAELHQWIFGEIKAGQQRGVPVTPVTLAHVYRERYDGAGIDAMYLARLVAASTSIVNIHDYAGIIFELAMKRVLQSAAAKMMEAPASESLVDLTAIMAEALSNAAMGNTTRRMHTSGQVREKILAKLRAGVVPDSTGIPKLDAAMGGGLYPGFMYGLSARKKMGKTIFAGTISHNLNHGISYRPGSSTPLMLPGVKHLFIAGEMGEEYIEQRNLARDLNLLPKRFLVNQDGLIDNDVIDQVAGAATTGPRNTIFVDAAGITLDELKTLIPAAVAKHKIRGFILDYWQLVKGGRPGAETAHLDAVAQYIAEACKRYNIWNITTGQLNREGTARGGDGLQNACEQHYILHRPDPTLGEAWLQQTDTRYTEPMNVGKKTKPGLILNPHGPYFEQAPENMELSPAWTESQEDDPGYDDNQRF